jgi:hypothetical protein
MARHNNWALREKATHLVIALWGQAANIQHRNPSEGTYEEIIMAFKVTVGTTGWPRRTVPS